MTSYLNREILNSWHTFLQEVELVKNHKQANFITSLGPPAPNPILDNLLPSLVYIRMVSLLDESLDLYIDSLSLTMPRRYGRQLNGRINFLDDQNVLLNAATLHGIRERRNELAHDVQRRVTWEEFDAALDMVEKELQHLNFVGNRPNYEFYAERSGMRDSPKEEVAFIQDYCYGLKEGGEKVIEVSWVVEIHRASSS